MHFRADKLHFDIRYVELRFQVLLIEIEVTVRSLRKRDRPHSSPAVFIVSFHSLIRQADVKIKLNFEIPSLGISGYSRPGKFLVGQGLGTKANKGQILEKDYRYSERVLGYLTQCAYWGWSLF